MHVRNRSLWQGKRGDLLRIHHPQTTPSAREASLPSSTDPELLSWRPRWPRCIWSGTCLRSTFQSLWESSSNQVEAPHLTTSTFCSKSLSYSLVVSATCQQSASTRQCKSWSSHRGPLRWRKLLSRIVRRMVTRIWIKLKMLPLLITAHYPSFQLFLPLGRLTISKTKISI